MVRGGAQEDLLGSYEAERRAVAAANTALSVANWEEALKVPRALGLDPAAAQLLHRAVSSSAASLLPPGVLPSTLYPKSKAVNYPIRPKPACWHNLPQCTRSWGSR